MSQQHSFSGKLVAVPRSGARTFAILYTLESLATASTTSVIPIQAYDLLKSKQAQISLDHRRMPFLLLENILRLRTNPDDCHRPR
jgi:hypothetical protein